MTDPYEIDVVIAVNAPTPVHPAGSSQVVRLTGVTSVVNADGTLTVGSNGDVIAEYAVAAWIGWNRVANSANPVIKHEGAPE